MLAVTHKIAVSLPAELYRSVEHLRKRTGRSRSAVVQEALRQWLKHQHEAALGRQYEEGYRRQPESRAEIQAAEAAAVHLLSSVEW